MPQRIRRKWRPSLLLVLGGALSGVLVSGLMGILVMPVLTPMMGRGPAAFFVLAVVLMATAVLAFLLWRLILGPVTALADRAHRLRDGEAGALAPLPRYGTQEITDLGESVLGMAAALRNRANAIRSYSDHVTHELKAPLSVIRGAAELLSDSELAAEDRRLVTTIDHASRRMESLLASLQAVAAAREPAAPGRSTLAALLPDLTAAFPALTLDATGDQITLTAPQAALSAALGHLAANALAHGATRLSIRAQDSAAGPVIEIGDDGPGIAEGNRARVFEPFFTTRRDRGGTGMGLAIVEGLLAAHGAEITLTDRQPGTWFRIAF